MKVMAITALGGPEVFQRQEWETPTAGPNEALVRIHATSVNPADIGARRGSNGPHSVTPPAVIGCDVAGVVESVGAEVHNIKRGDEVYYAIPLGAGLSGSYAEYHVTPAFLLSKKPRNISFAQAASVPVAGGTAWAALVTRGAIQPGSTVLIHGGAGGVGSFAVQIAKAAGAYVFSTCSGTDFERVKSLGANRVIDYRTQKFAEIVMQETAGEGVDLSFTTVGGSLFAESMAVTKMGGKVITITGPASGLEAAEFLAVGRNLTLHFVHLDNTPPKLDALRALIERGQIVPLISKILPLAQIAEAHQRQEEGGPDVYGKTVLQVV